MPQLEAPAVSALAGQAVVVKLSGKALESSASWSRDIAALHRAGARVVVVHGAGKQITELGEALGLQASFVNGLRVTDAPTLRAAEMALASVGKEVVEALQAHGVLALGISGRDAALLQAQRREPALGFVGRVTGVNLKALEQLLAAGFVPVLSPIAAGPGCSLNTNADEAAQAVAVALGAKALLLLSDVDGVQGPSGRVANATPASIAALRASGLASGGMLPKLEACAAAVSAGVGMVRILKGEASLLAALDPNTDLGTLVVAHGL